MKPGEPQDIDAFLREMEAQQAPEPTAAPMPEQPQTAGAFLREIQQAPQPSPAPAMPQLPRGELVQPTGYMESLTRGLEQGATFGFADEARAAIATGVEALRRQLGEGLGSQVALQFAAQLAGPLAPLAQQELSQESLRAQAMAPKTQDLSLAQIREQRLQEERFLNEQARLSNPKTYLGGQVGGGLATTAAVTASTGGAATPFLSGLGGSVAMGGLQGLGESEADLTKGEFAKAFEDTSKGMAFGAAGYGVAKALPVVAKTVGKKLGQVAQTTGIAQAASKLGDKLDEAMREFEAFRAVKATGAIQSDLKKYIQAGGDTTRLRRIGETLQEEDVIPFLGNKEEISKRALALQDAANERMTEIYSLADKVAETAGVKKPFNYSSLTKSVNALERSQQAASRMENAGIFDKFREVVAAARKQSPGFADANFEKADFAKTFKAYSSAVTEGQRKAAAEIERIWNQQIESQLDDTFNKIVPAEHTDAIMGALAKAKRNWEAAAATEAGTMRAALQMGNNPLGLSAVVMGGPATAQGLSTSGLTGATATGLAMAAATEFARRRGSAIAGQTSRLLREQTPKAARAVASSANKLSQAIQRNPAAFGRFAQPLMQALQTSPQSLAVMDYTLSNQSPEYRELRDALLEQEQTEGAPAGMSLKELLDMEGAQ